jgi:hypothetical protein
VLGVVDRASKAIKMEVVANRNMLTMNEFARRHISPGPQTKTDGWKAYGGYRTFWRKSLTTSVREPRRLTRDVVNHNAEFVTTDGTHINNIENSWTTFKRIHAGRYGSSGSLQPFLDEFCFRWSFCGGSIQNRGLFWVKLARAMDCCAAERCAGGPFLGAKLGLRA